MPEYDPIVTSRRYVLAEDERGYGIWERDRAEPLERFPATDEGFEAAEHLLRRLRGARRWGGEVVPRILVFAIFGATILWILTILAQLGMALWEPEGERAMRLYQAVLYLDTFAFRLAVGAVVSLAGLLLARRLGAFEDPLESRDDVRATPRPVGESIGRAVLLGGLATWVVAGTVGNALEPREPFQLFGREPPSEVALLAATISSIALRIWVTALVVLAVRWIARLGARRPAAPDGV